MIDRFGKSWFRLQKYESRTTTSFGTIKPIVPIIVPSQTPPPWKNLELKRFMKRDQGIEKRRLETMRMRERKYEKYRDLFPRRRSRDC